MGQLEKYGLYVLCLVIFLILGVALWGEPAGAAEPPKPQTTAQGPAPRSDAFELRDLNAVVPSPGGGQRTGRNADRREPEAGHRAAEADAKNDGGHGAAKADAKNDGSKNDGGKGGGGDKDKKPAPADGRRTHTIVAGDTLEAIAKQLGGVQFVALLHDLNPTVTPEKLKIGKTLVLPSEAELAAARKKAAADDKKSDDKRAGDKKADEKKADEKKADDKKLADDKKGEKKPAARPLAAARTHRIEQGDTLEGLAQRLLGNKRRVDDIKNLNPGLDPTRLRIGQLIKLPAE